MNDGPALISVLAATNGVASQTRFPELAYRGACEPAAGAIRDHVLRIAGTLSPEVIAPCHPQT